jgi:hypothetical protein
MFTARGSS